jgi:hypothetical protein
MSSIIGLVDLNNDNDGLVDLDNDNDCLVDPDNNNGDSTRKAVGDDPMPFTFDELMIWARPLVMVVDHRNKTPETM